MLINAGSCVGYEKNSSSDYVLPYPTGEIHLVSQGNCYNFSHKAEGRYAYDFSMEIGDDIVAVRSGVVIYVKEDSVDDNGGLEANVIYIEHSDHSVAQYAHLTENGSEVAVDDSVTQGALIGHAGNTGYSTGAHLHFSVLKSASDSQTIPITFRNSSPQAIGPLSENVRYSAL